MVAAADHGNATADNPNATPNQIGMSHANSNHGKLIPNNDVQHSSALPGDVKKVNDSSKNVKDINTNNVSPKQVKTMSDKDIASSVAELSKNHDINSIAMATGLTPAQVNKMIKDIKSGVYGSALKKSLLKKDQALGKNMAKAVTVLYGKHGIDSIGMSTGLTHRQVTKMIKDIKHRLYGSALKKSLLKKDKQIKNKKLVKKISDLYGINTVKDISQITGVKISKVEKIIGDIKGGVYGKTLQNHICQSEILIF